MAAILVFVAVILGWRFFASFGSRFQREFAKLMDDPTIQTGLTSFISRYSTVKGKYHGRPVELLIQQPLKHSPGMVRLSMRLVAPPGTPWKDSTLTRQNPDISRATFDLEGRYELILVREGEWLRAQWSSPAGVLFPGRFDETRWRHALAQMKVLVDWMEAARAE